MTGNVIGLIMDRIIRLTILSALVLLTLWISAASAYVINVRGNIPLTDTINAVAVNPSSDLAAAVSSEARSLYWIDLSSNTVIGQQDLAFIPSDVAFGTTGDRAIISSKDGDIYTVTLPSDSITKILSTGNAMNSFIPDKTGANIYIGSGNVLTLIALNTGLKIIEAVLPHPVTGIDIDTAPGYILITMEGKDGLSVYEMETLSHLFNMETGSITASVSVNPSTHIALLTNKSDNTISIISLEKRMVSDTLTLIDPDSGQLLEQPDAIAVASMSHTALISHKEGIAVVKLQNPLPEINSLVPDSARSGDDGVLLSIKGSNFIRESRAQFNKKDMPIWFNSNESLGAEISRDDLSTPGNAPVTVTNPPPGGGQSNTLMFTIYNPMPAIEHMSPDTLAMSSLPAKVRIYGKNFMPRSRANLNGQYLKTKFISSIILEAEVNLSHVSKGGKYAAVVVNPSPGAFTSNAVSLSVTEDPADNTPDPDDESGASPSQENRASEKKQKLTGTLRGRIINTQKEPVEGVTVKIKNVSTRTGPDGYFELENIPAGKRNLLIRGVTARDQSGHYPTIPLSVTIQENAVNEMPFQVYLHRQKNRNFKDISLTEDTILTDPEVPGFELRIPKGVNIIGWDGQPNRKVSVRTVPVDRLPIKPLPSSANVRTVYMFYFGKEGGGTPDIPIPVKAKNDIGLLPGEKATLWYYDESPNEGEAPNDWAVAGTGTVSPDGKYIISDPGVGIPKFCCGATAVGGQSSVTPKSGPEDGETCTTAGDPVDIATGYFLHEKTDLHIPGIIPVNITRYYRSRESGSAVSGDTGFGMFGKGTYFEYDWWLGDYGGMFLLVKPGNYQHRFDVQQPDGTYINDTDPLMRDAVLTINPDNTKTLTMRSGWTYTFDSSGDLTEIADRNGNALTFTRRSDFEGGYIKKITTAEGRTITFNQQFVPGPAFRTDSIVDDATGRTVTYTYDDDPFSNYPRLRKITYPDGSMLEYQFDSEGRMSGIVNERGVLEVFNEYDSNNRVIRQTHIDAGVYTFNYTEAGGNITETTMTGPNGAQTTWGFYDYATGSVFHDKYITYMITSDGTTVYDRSAADNPVTGEILNGIKTVTDPLGRTLTYTYYPDGRTETVTDNLDNITLYEYEPVYGLISKITDADLKDTVITYTYDVDDRITKIETEDPLLKKTTVNFNSYGMPTDITDPNLNVTTFLYENTGKPAELTKITDMLLNTFTLAYDTAGRLVSVTDAKGKSTTYTYDIMDRVKEVKDPLGRTTRFRYDFRGNLTSVIDAKEQVIRYTYDNRDRLKTIMDQVGRVTSYAYYTDAEITSTTGDNLKSVTDRKGQTTIFNEYDPMNRIKKITYHDTSFTEYTYDAAGRMDYINDSLSGFIDFTYNDFGCAPCSGSGMDRIAQVVTPLGTIDYTYDKLGRRKTMTVAGQDTVNYDYYDNGWLENIRQVINSVEQKFNFEYDDGGRRDFLKYFRGGSATPDMKTDYGFDNANRLRSLEHLDSLDQVLESLSYNYDPNGNITDMDRQGVSLPLRSGVDSVSYNSANQMLTYTPESAAQQDIIHDENGNMTSVTNTCGTTTYTWDVRNRLTGINGYKPDCSVLTAGFQYDALGRRMEKTVNGVTTQYLYDGADIIQEIQNSVVIADYIRGLTIDEPLSRITSGGPIRNYMTDASGSVIGLADDTGVVKTTYTYDPFGNTVVSGEASGNPFQYTARENDGTGLYYYRARYYSPELQRFISEDPIGLAGGINMYAYVGNNPVNFYDPMGLWSISLEGYLKAGGGFVFGKNPGGDYFLTFRYGYGIGGGVSYNPQGTSPGWDPCENYGPVNVGVGGYGGASVGLGPAYAGISGNVGVNVGGSGHVQTYAGVDPEYGLDWGWSLRGGAAVGVEITFF